LNAATSDPSGSASNSGIAGSGRSRRGKFARMDARMSVRLLISPSSVLPVPVVERLLGWMEYLAMFVPGVEAVVDNEARQVRERRVHGGNGSAVDGWPRQQLARRPVR
jgi:hypothetical protein